MKPKLRQMEPVDWHASPIGSLGDPREQPSLWLPPARMIDPSPPSELPSSDELAAAAVALAVRHQPARVD